ncbi:hypothetical protein ACU4GD_40535 [Cupriavidus basilensis]
MAKGRARSPVPSRNRQPQQAYASSGSVLGQQGRRQDAPEDHALMP